MNKSDKPNLNRPINDIEDIFFYVSKDTGYDIGLIRFVYYNFWSSIKFYLMRPHLCGIGIKVDKYLTILLREGKMWNLLQKSIRGERKRRKDPHPVIPSYYRALLEEYQHLKEQMNYIKCLEIRKYLKKYGFYLQVSNIGRVYKLYECSRKNRKFLGYHPNAFDSPYCLYRVEDGKLVKKTSKELEHLKREPKVIGPSRIAQRAENAKRERVESYIEIYNPDSIEDLSGQEITFLDPEQYYKNALDEKEKQLNLQKNKTNG